MHGVVRPPDVLRHLCQGKETGSGSMRRRWLTAASGASCHRARVAATAQMQAATKRGGAACGLSGRTYRAAWSGGVHLGAIFRI